MVPSNVRIVQATADHAYDLAPFLRRADRQEIMASTGHDPLVVLLHSIDVSPFAYSALDERGVIAMYGIGAPAVVSDYGSPWLLGTDRLTSEQYKVPFLRESRAFVARARRLFNYLFNFVDTRNEASIRWLQFCGFTIHTAKPHGPYNMPFHFFDWRKD